MTPIDYYRVQCRMVSHKGGYRYRADRWWARTWQAEWAGCQLAPRAWTRRGIERKATRWYEQDRRAAAAS